MDKVQIACLLLAAVSFGLGALQVRLKLDATRQMNWECLGLMFAVLSLVAPVFK